MLAVNSNIKGNTQFEITSEVAQVFNEYYGDDFFPETDPSSIQYKGVNKYPYPFKLSLLELFDKLEYFGILNNERKYGKAPKEIQEIVDQFTSYIFQKTQLWSAANTDPEITEVSGDCFFSYLILAYLGKSLIFLDSDGFGKGACVPIKLRRLSYSPAGLMNPPSVNLRYDTYHYYSEQEYYRVQNNISLPIGESLTLKESPFVHDVEAAHQHLMVRFEKLKSLAGSACQSYNAANPNKTPFTLTNFMGRLAPEMALNERYLFNPKVTETHFEVYDDLAYDTYLVNMEDEPIESWYYSRTVAVFSMKRLRGRLANLDWLIETPYDKERINTLILPEDKKKELLAMCMGTKNRTSYADPFRGKSAKIVLLEGVPGTGKTSSIIGISDYLEMPLIHLAITDLGDYKYIGNSLSRILQLAESFGAFVLVDEADVLLKSRNIDNLQHNNIVTAVLKELESFNGLLFLTSNLDFANVDSAIRSRLKRRFCFEYPSEDVLRQLWSLNLNNIGLEVAEEQLGEIVKVSYEVQLDLRKVVNICSLIYDLLCYDPDMTIDVLEYVKEA